MEAVLCSITLKIEGDVRLGASAEGNWSTGPVAAQRSKTTGRL